MSDEPDCCCDPGYTCTGNNPPPSVTRYCYNTTDGKCNSFQYLGCGGGDCDNYGTSAECHAACPSSESEGKQYYCSVTMYSCVSTISIRV